MFAVPLLFTSFSFTDCRKFSNKIVLLEDFKSVKAATSIGNILAKTGEREHLNYFIVCFQSVYPVFPKSLYSFPDLFAVRYLWVVCNEDECCVVTHRRAADFALLGLFRFAPIACHGVKRVQAKKTRFRRSKAKLKRTLEKQYISRDRSKLVCEVRRNENCSFISIFAPILRLKYFCSQQSVVVEEIQEVELRFRRALFIYDRNYNPVGLQPQSCMHVAVCCRKGEK